MKNKLLLLFLLFQVTVISAQDLKGILSDYTINTLPSDRPIVGSKWSADLGPTTEGLTGDKIVISRSLNNMSLTAENKQQLNIALLTLLSLDGYGGNSISVVFNELQIHTIKNLYEVPLIKNEMLVFSAVKAKSFDLIYDKSLNSAVKAKIPLRNLKIDAETDLGGKKRLTLSGSDLFVAQKVVKVVGINTRTKSKKLNEGFSVSGILGYDLSFNVNQLINAVEKSTIKEIGQTRYDELSGLGQYMRKYANAAPIKVSIVSKDNGTTVGGIFTKVIEVCYCKMFGDVDGKMFLINSTNDGNELKFDYLYMDNFWITIKKGGVTFLTTSKESKVSVITKSYSLAALRP